VENCIGIDVSKATINVHIPKSNQDLLLDNNLKSFRSLFSKLKKYIKKRLKISSLFLNQQEVIQSLFENIVQTKRSNVLS